MHLVEYRGGSVEGSSGLPRVVESNGAIADRVADADWPLGDPPAACATRDRVTAQRTVGQVRRRSVLGACARRAWTSPRGGGLPNCQPRRSYRATAGPPSSTTSSTSSSPRFAAQRHTWSSSRAPTPCSRADGTTNSRVTDARRSRRDPGERRERGIIVKALHHADVAGDAAGVPNDPSCSQPGRGKSFDGIRWPASGIPVGGMDGRHGLHAAVEVLL